MVKPLAVACFAFSSLYNSAATAQDFRVETKVRVDKKTEFEFLTLFRGTTVYDFGVDNGEISIFDMSRGHVTLVDKNRELRTIVLFTELREFSQELLKRAVARGEKGFFDPNIVYRVDEDADLPFSAATNVLGYAAKGTKPPEKDVVLRYRRFSDVAALLSGMKPHGIPPFVRLRLNEGMADAGFVPTKVVRTIVQPKLIRNNKLVVVAEHEFNWLIAAKDDKQIDEVDSWLSKCDTVPLRKYLEIKPIVAELPRKPRVSR